METNKIYTVSSNDFMPAYEYLLSDAPASFIVSKFEPTKLCLVFGDNKEHLKDRINTICEAVNNYDKLKEDNEVLLNALKGLYEFNLGKPDYLDTLLNNAESAIKKAESK